MIRALPAGYNAGDTVYCYFPAYNAAGASLTITGLAVTDIEVYKNGGTTQRSSDAGYTLLDTDGIDFDSSTGLHGFSIDTSDNTDSGFWADGSHYLIWVDAVTIDSQTVRFGFELLLGVVLRPTTAGRKLTVESDGMAHADLKEILGVAQSATDLKDFADDGYDPSTNKIQGLVLADSLTAVATGGITAGSIATDAIGADEVSAAAVTKIQTGLATPTNITAGTITTVTNLTNAPTNGDLTATMKASVNTEVDTALADIHLDHLLAATYDPDSKPGAADALLNELVESDGGVSRFTASALDQAPTGGASAADIADAVWDEDITEHADPDSAGLALASAGSAGDPWATSLPGAYSSGQAGFILGTNLDMLLSDVPTRAEITGGNYALDTDANGRVRIVDGAGAGELDTASGRVLADVRLWIGATPNALNSGRVDSHVSTFGTSAKSDIETEVNDALVAIHLDHLLATTYDPASKPGAADALLNELIESDSGVARFTANSLEEAPTGGGGGDATEANQDIIIALLGTPAGASVSADIAAVKAQTAAIEADTQDLQTSVAGLPSQADITGGAYALDTDVNGRVRVVDGTGAGEIDTASGRVQITEAQVDQIVAEVEAGDLSTLLTRVPDILSLANINGEIVDVMAVDTHAQPGQGLPPATAAYRDMLRYVYKAFRNKHEQTETEYRLFGSDGSTVDHKATVSDSSGTTTRGALVSGA